MIKKDYMQPALEVVATDTDAQLLAGTVDSVSSEGLDDEDALEYLKHTGSSWTEGV